MKKPVSKPAKPSKPPSNPLIDANRILGEVERNRKAKNTSKALSLCQALLKRHPDFVGALHNLGMIYVDMNDMKSAVRPLAYAVALNPTNTNIQLALANVYREIGADEQATRLLEALVENTPNQTNPLLALGKQLSKNRAYDRALSVYQKMLDLNPTSSAAWEGIGVVKSETGHPEEAAAAWNTSLSYGPPSIATIRALARMPTKLVTENLEDHLAKLGESTQDSSTTDKVSHGFAEALISIQKGEFKEGYEHLHSANALQFKKMKTEYESLKTSRAGFRVALNSLPINGSEPKASNDLPTSIHMFGPSRSGKTTLERLLGTLDDVQCGYESPILRTTTRRTYMDSGLPTQTYSYLLPASTDRRYLEIYRELLTGMAGGKAFFISTTPGRIFDVYHMARIIPNLRVIFVKRDIDDVVDRMYRTLYSTGHTHSYNLDAAREYVTWYYSMQDRYAEMLPNFTKTITYEDMVVDPLKVANEVRQFCGIPGEFGALPDIGDDRGVAKAAAKFLH